MPERYQLEEYMDMYDGKVVLCGANSYEEKYYLNPDFEHIKLKLNEYLLGILKENKVEKSDSFK